MDKEPITVQGLENLKFELEDLKNIQRPKVVAAIAEARSHGDLKENGLTLLTLQKLKMKERLFLALQLKFKI